MITPDDYNNWIECQVKNHNINPDSLTLTLAARRDFSRSCAINAIRNAKLLIRQKEILIDNLKPYEIIDAQYRVCIGHMEVLDKLSYLGCRRVDMNNPVTKKRLSKKKRQIKCINEPNKKLNIKI
jgi:hypothetical protein